MLTAEQIIKKVCDALDAQGCQCVEGGCGCVLRNGLGNKCALGHLIPDDKYDPRMEADSSVDAFTSVPKYNQILLDEGIDTDKHYKLLVTLQLIHDKWNGGEPFSVAFKRHWWNNQ